MREIKFRAWDRLNKEMINVYVLDQTGLAASGLNANLSKGYNDKGQREFYLHNVILMQYTGLKDKNGVEIYEGDIVRFYKGYVDDTWTDMEQGNPYTIEWQNQEGYLGFRARNGNKNITLLAGTYNGIAKWEWEVIGNIYENQDLLNSDQNPERSVASKDDSSNTDD